MKIDLIGKRYGEDSQFEILKSLGYSKYTVFCHKCNTDVNLFPNVFVTKLSHLKNHRYPCGCSKSHKYTSEQYKLLLDRASNIGGQEVISSKNLLLSKSIIEVKCKRCCFYYSTSVRNFLKTPNCRFCLKTDRNYEKQKLYLESIPSFKGCTFFRSSKKHYWDYTCQICSNDEYVESGECSGIFTTKTYFVNKGIKSCRCGGKGGFDTNKEGVLYLISTETFLGFGISNKIGQRIQKHRRNLIKAGHVIKKDRILLFFRTFLC